MGGCPKWTRRRGTHWSRVSCSSPTGTLPLSHPESGWWRRGGSKRGGRREDLVKVKVDDPGLGRGQRVGPGSFDTGTDSSDGGVDQGGGTGERVPPTPSGPGDIRPPCLVLLHETETPLRPETVGGDPRGRRTVPYTPTPYSHRPPSLQTGPGASRPDPTFRDLRVGTQRRRDSGPETRTQEIPGRIRV